MWGVPRMESSDFDGLTAPSERILSIPPRSVGLGTGAVFPVGELDLTADASRTQPGGATTHTLSVGLGISDLISVRRN